VTFEADHSQVRCGHIPQVMAALRNTVIGRCAGQVTQTRRRPTDGSPLSLEPPCTASALSWKMHGPADLLSHMRTGAPGVALGRRTPADRMEYAEC
jgi:hypothetical protein